MAVGRGVIEYEARKLADFAPDPFQDRIVPHFYFHLATDSGYKVDDEGLSFPDLEAAYLEACRAALDMSFEMLRAREDPKNHRFEIVDTSGAVLLDLPFAEVLQPHLAHLSPPTGGALHAGVKAGIARNRALRDDLSCQIRAAQLTLKTTRALLARTRMDSPDTASMWSDAH